MGASSYSVTRQGQVGSSTKILKEPDTLQVINLSSYQLTEVQISLLQKGLSYTPTPQYNYFNWVKDVNLFARKLALHKYHTIQDSNRYLHRREEEAIETLVQLATEHETGVVNLTGPFSILKPRSQFTPPFSQYSNIDTFVQMVTCELRKLRPINPQVFGNLTPGEQSALKSLEDNNDLVWKPSDKGGNVVIMDKDDYTNMSLRLLNDSETYTFLSSNPTASFLHELKNILIGAKDDLLISDEEFQFLYNANPFYALPKTQNSVWQLQSDTKCQHFC